MLTSSLIRARRIEAALQRVEVRRNSRGIWPILSHLRRRYPWVRLSKKNVRVAMPKVSYIVARTKDNVIGCNNGLPWRLSSDLRRFRQITSGKVVIMGRKTFESIGKPLPNRVNVVVSRNNSCESKDLIFCKDLSTAIFVGDIISNIRSLDEMFIIGGEQIFNSMGRYVSRVYLTEIQADDVVGDSYFNMEFSAEHWRTKHREFVHKSDVDQFDYEYRILDKKGRSNRSRSALNVMSGGMPEAELLDLIATYSSEVRSADPRR